MILGGFLEMSVGVYIVHGDLLKLCCGAWLFVKQQKKKTNPFTYLLIFCFAPLQPIYWPAPIPTNPTTYQKAWQSMQLKSQQNGHPQSDLSSIFGKADRLGDYQHYASDALNMCLDLPDAGAQVTYPGDLIENIGSLAGRFNGYNSDWNATYNAFFNQHSTSTGAPRMDLVAFTYHHALAAIIDRASLAMEIAIHKQVYPKAWGNQRPYSKGFFPAEMVFSERNIPALVEAGIEWVLVPNNHFSRACKDYPFSPSGDNCNPPNKADQVNPAQTHYFEESVSRGVRPNNAYPFSYRPHYAKHVDPETGKESKIIVVPVAMAMSWVDSTACYNTQDILKVGTLSDPKHPVFVVLGHDGDNSFSGGWTYYNQCVSQLLHSSGIHPTTVQTYLSQYPVDPDDVIHVESGGWINKDGDFGSPQSVGWRWPPTNSTGGFDIVNGWDCNQRNWAVITAGQNFVDTAEAAMGGVNPAQVQQPTSSATPAELAWHFFLPSLNSGYMYYGTILDMPVKQTIACNSAIEYAKKAIAAGNGKDTVGPSIWATQRLPYNPGGFGGM
jgi:Glycosyl hydrolase family 57